MHYRRKQEEGTKDRLKGETKDGEQKEERVRRDDDEGKQKGGGWKD